MTKFNKKALIVASVVATLAAAPIVFAATTAPTAFGPMGGFGPAQMMARFGGPAVGNRIGFGMGMAAGMTDENGNPIQVPAMSAEQLAFMRTQLDKLPADQRAFMETQLQAHGVTLPDAK